MNPAERAAVDREAEIRKLVAELEHGWPNAMTTNMLCDLLALLDAERARVAELREVVKAEDEIADGVTETLRAVERLERHAAGFREGVEAAAMLLETDPAGRSQFGISVPAAAARIRALAKEPPR